MLEFVRISGVPFDEDDIEVCILVNMICLFCLIVSFDHHIVLTNFQTVNSYLVWGGIAIHYADQYSKVTLIVFSITYFVFVYSLSRPLDWIGFVFVKTFKYHIECFCIAAKFRRNRNVNIKLFTQLHMEIESHICIIQIYWKGCKLGVFTPNL